MTIQINNLTKTYRKGFQTGKPAVDSLTLSVQEGEVFGILGPNGAGKSTVIKILMNFIRPSDGTVEMNGYSVSEPQARRSVGYLPENPLFYDHLTAEEIMQFGGRAARMKEIEIRNRMESLFGLFKLSHVKRQRLRTYSKGMVQRTGLALALIHDPKICILDEPMSGLDAFGRRLVTDLIEEMRHNGRTVFLASHSLRNIESVCDRVGVLNHGRLLFCGGTKEFVAGSGALEQSFIQLIEKDES